MTDADTERSVVCCYGGKEKDNAKLADAARGAGVIESRDYAVFKIMVTWGSTAV
jgi:hypothetical protein